MSNKINKYFLLIGILISCVMLGAVEFKQTQFTTDYQFALYRAWLARGGFSTQVPTRFFLRMPSRVMGRMQLIQCWYAISGTMVVSTASGKSFPCFIR